MHVCPILKACSTKQSNWKSNRPGLREVLEESRELRIVLCRPKISGSRTGSAVVAACGEHISHLVHAKSASLVDTLCGRFAVHCSLCIVPVLKLDSSLQVSCPVPVCIEEDF